MVVSLACFGGGGVVAILVYPVLALVLHVVLVLVAIVTDAPAGGPLALPFMLAVATVAGIAYTVLAFVVVGASTLLVSWARRRVLAFVVVNVALLILGVVVGVLVFGVREPAMATAGALAWSAGIAAGGLPAWVVIATVWFGLRMIGGVVRWAENSPARRDRAVLEA
ncbi:hypothetical protein [Myceligenerans salitolerans]|uniref:Uncharacterized protein n=1 Tax=Myceligenerans salitolerans TaxID=1230528 RepID=A0ABS3I7X5_9MICO|nr:hypothetical protein [Myceligenerans salitolerans]MBO0609115.1 hypothetical protein [Myceligenerans salitolerans]